MRASEENNTEEGLWETTTWKTKDIIQWQHRKVDVWKNREVIMRDSLERGGLSQLLIHFVVLLSKCGHNRTL